MHKSQRFTLDEANEIVKSIPSLKNLLASKGGSKAANDTNGFMYFSRFIKEDLFVKNEETEVVESVVSKRNIDLENSEESVGVEINIADESINSSNMSSKLGYEKKRRYAMSLATLAMKPEKQNLIVNEGAIPILLDLANSHDAAIQARCASAFASLSKNTVIRTRMLEEGALTSIILLCTNAINSEVKSNCCRAICNLCCEKGYEFRMVKEGVPFLMTHCSQTCPDTIDVQIKTLLNISCISEKFHRIEDVIEAVMHFMSYQLSEEEEFLLITTLCNLSALRNNQLRLVEDGCLKIVEKFYRSPNKKLRSVACEVLKNLTTDNRTRMKLLELNVMALLVDMSKDPEDEIRVQCLKSYLFLSKDEHFRQKIVDSDAIIFILKTGQERQSDLGTVVAKTLRVLCSDKEIATKLLNYGLMATISALLKASNQLIHQFCIECICGLLHIEKIMHILMKKEIDVLIINLSLVTKNVKTCEWCAFALLYLVKNKICTQDVVQESILPCVNKLCENSSNITKAFCSATFAEITLNKQIDCSMVVPLLVRMLKTETDNITRNYCALSLFNLAYQTENCFLMLEAEALPPVIQLTQSDFIQTKVLCAGIISRLSLHKQYYHQFTSSVLKVLLELSCVDHRLTQRRVVIALSNLSQNEDLRLLLIQLNPIPYIVSLAAERDEYIRRGCISIVCNMSYTDGSERAIVEANIIPTLLITSLITSDQLISKIICVKALVNLMADKSLYQLMVKDGVIWGLSKLAQLQNMELLSLCSKALCNLSIQFGKDLMKSAVAMRCVMEMIERPEFDFKRTAARTLTNLLLQTNNDDVELRKLSVSLMPSLAKSDDKEMMEMCILCLCLCSQSSSCRDVIVMSGVLELIVGGSIFTDPKISYAYISMFRNLAHDPKLRVKLLDDRTIERFENVCICEDPSVDLAVVKALYCLTCCATNLPSLVDQNIISFIRKVISLMTDEVDVQISLNVTRHLIASIYNLTTCYAVHASLVSQGCIELLVEIWPKGMKEFLYCQLIMKSVCHLACGKTNSARIVEGGSTQILTFIANHKAQGYNAYTFSPELKQHCSAALRNLLSVVANQKIMLEQGCLDALIKLAQEANKLSREINFNNSMSTRSSMANISAAFTRANCAAALKAMTYNKEIRDALVSSDAINIILEEVRKEGYGTGISQGLLRELEAESWDNGSRKKTKEQGRLKNIPTQPIYEDLLQETSSNVDLNVEKKFEVLEKYYVQIVIESNSVGDDEGVILEEVGVNNLISFEDMEETTGGVVMAYSKQECEVFFPQNSNLDTNSIASHITEDENELNNSKMKNNHDTSYTDIITPSASKNNDSTISLPKISSNTPPININDQSLLINPQRESLPELIKKNKHNKSKRDKIPQSISMSADKSIDKESSQKKFDDFVQFILKSKDKNDRGQETVEAILGKWKDFSKF